MTVYTQQSMTNHHHADLSHLFGVIFETLHTWRARYRSRQELAQLTDRDFHDVGSSWSDFAYEASKPFWRA